MINLEPETIDDIILFGPIILFFSLLIASHVARKVQRSKTAKICGRMAMSIYFIYVGCAMFLLFAALSFLFSWPLVLLLLVIVAIFFLVFLTPIALLFLYFIPKKR